MGLFDGLKTMVDIVKAGINAVKATDKMDEIVEKVASEYSDKLTTEEQALLKAFKQIKALHDAEEDLDKANAMTDDVEKAEVEFLMALTRNEALPDSFKDEIGIAVEAYIKSNDAPAEILEKRFMKMAKTEEEKEFVRKMMDEVKED